MTAEKRRPFWGMGRGALVQLSMPAVGASLEELKTQSPRLNDYLVHGVGSQVSKAYLIEASHSQFCLEIPQHVSSLALAWNYPSGEP